MFDDNHNDLDLMFRSALQEGQEEVPAHVWDSISSGLDKAARRRKTLVIFRRCAAGISVAAALGVGIIMSYRQSGSGLTAPVAGEDMIAVVPQETVGSEDSVKNILIAEGIPEAAGDIHEDRIVTTAAEAARNSDITDEAYESVTLQDCEAGAAAGQAIENTCPTDNSVTAGNDTVTAASAVENNPGTDKTSVKKPAHETSGTSSGFDDFWEDEAPARKKIRTSIELSSLAGTNNSNNPQAKGLMKRPSISYTQEKTGIKENSTKSTFGLPISFGAGVRFDFTPRWSLSAGVNYSLLTRKFFGTYTSVDEEGNIDWTESSDIRNSQHYVGIPVNAYFNIVNKDFLRFYVYAGGTVEKCVADKYNVLASSIVHTEKVKGVQLSANVGIGLEFLLGKHLGIYVDPSLRYYFNNGQPTSIRTEQPLMLGFEAGLRIRI